MLSIKLVLYQMYFQPTQLFELAFKYWNCVIYYWNNQKNIHPTIKNNNYLLLTDEQRNGLKKTFGYSGKKLGSR